MDSVDTEMATSNYKLTSRIVTLPQDCKNYMLEFLSMRDCLAYGGTSITSLFDVRIDLERRQKRMSQDFAYSIDRTLGSENQGRLTTPSWTGWKLHGPSRDCKSDFDKTACILPTVRDRIEVLFRTISLSHPLAGSVRDLRHEILEPSLARDSPERTQDDELDHSSSFQLALTNVVRLTRSHRLHAYVLRRAIQSEPTHWERGYSGARSHYRQPGNGVTTGNVLTVTLERYMGDVLCAYFLMGHSAAGIVDGGPTEEAWTASIVQDLGRRRHLQQPGHEHESDHPTRSAVNSEGPVASSYRVGSAIASYRAWIFLHSTLLRTAAFTRDQQMVLGVAPPLPPFERKIQNDASRGLLLCPDKPYCGFRKLAYAQLLTTMDTLEPQRVTFNDFGRLGMTFRGRDLIQSHTMQPTGCLDTIVAFEQMGIDLYDAQRKPGDQPLSSQSTFVRSWILGDNPVMQWLVELHTEGAKVRPLTVTPPLVTVRCTGY